MTVKEFKEKVNEIPEEYDDNSVVFGYNAYPNLEVSDVEISGDLVEIVM